MGEFVRIMWSLYLLVFSSLRLLPHGRELSLSCRAFYFTWSKTLSSHSALYFTWSRMSSFFVLRFILRRRRRRRWLYVCTCAVEYCLLVSCFFFLFSGKGYTNSRELSLHKRNDPWKIDSPLITTPYHILSLLPCTLSFTFSFCRFIGRIPSMFLPSLAHRSSGFNFVHFCFLNYFFVSSIRWRQSYFRKILYFRLLFHKSAKL